ncbi:hypothetical protein EON65_02775 [archaeon]|nr:MAG: hypothetical protein EON65_02775 [archaeon]
MNWLKVADGWVVEELLSSSGKKLNLCPLCKTAEPVETGSHVTSEKKEVAMSPATPQSSSPSARERKVYSRKHFLSRFNSQPPLASGTAGQPEVFESEDKGASRLEKIVRMQNDLHRLTEQLSDMTLKMVQFQKQLAVLTQGE